jgi:hypothetical protein
MNGAELFPSEPIHRSSITLRLSGLALRAIGPRWYIVRTLFSAGSGRIQSEGTARAFVDRSGHATLGADAPGAGESSAMLSPQALHEIAQVEAEIDRIVDRAASSAAGQSGPTNRVAR